MRSKDSHKDRNEIDSEATTLRRPSLIAHVATITAAQPDEPMSEAAPFSVPRLEQTRFGPYQLVCELASGGMATVYLALFRAEGFEKLCAVKRVHPHLASDREFAEMFIDEAQIAARISHSFVCHVFSFGKSQGQHYIAMEYLRGESLAALHRRTIRKPELLEDERFPRLAARLLANLAEGLHAAHSLRDDLGKPLEVVHRDVTPQNLFVLYDGSVRVTDFGIAHAKQRVHQTEDRKVKGKLAYLAPEQLEGADADPRADIWALGVVLWELLTGHRLFFGRSEGETISAITARAIPPPSALRSAIPAELDRIVLRALERDLPLRYRTARELARDLERFLTTSGDTVPAMDVAEWMTAAFPHGPERIQRLESLAAQVSDATEEETRIRTPPPPRPRNDRESWSSIAPPPPSEAERTPSTDLEAAPSAEPSAVFELVQQRSRGHRLRRGAFILGALAAFFGLFVGFEETRPPRAAYQPAHAPSASTHGGAPLVPIEEDHPEWAPHTHRPVEATPRRAHLEHLHMASAAAVPPPAGHGELLITTPGGSGDVFEQGKRLGHAPGVFHLSAGHHSLVVQPESGPGHSLGVDIVESASVVVTVSLG